MKQLTQNCNVTKEDWLEADVIAQRIYVSTCCAKNDGPSDVALTQPKPASWPSGWSRLQSKQRHTMMRRNRGIGDGITELMLEALVARVATTLELLFPGSEVNLRQAGHGHGWFRDIEIVLTTNHPRMPGRSVLHHAPHPGGVVPHGG